MKRRRSFALGLAVLTLLMGCGGGGGDSPEAVAVRWRSAYEKGDFGTVWDLEGDELHAAAGRDVGIAALQRDYKPPTPDHQVVSVKASRTLKDTSGQKDKYVFVYLDTKPRDYPVHHEVVTLRKVGSVWRVAKWEP